MMTQRQYQPQTLVEADRVIADATARIARLRAQIAELESHGCDFSGERVALHEFEAVVELLRRQRGMVVRLRQIAQRLRVERTPTPYRRWRPKNRNVWPRGT